MFHDLGSQISVQPGGAASIVAAGAGDATLVTGPFINRAGFRSCTFGVVGKATLANLETLKVDCKLRDATAAAGTGVADFGTLYTAQTMGTGVITAGAVSFQADQDLLKARQYIAVVWTPDLSAGATDTAVLAGFIVLGGARNLPQ
jgi:hypothetical protein